MPKIIYYKHVLKMLHIQKFLKIFMEFSYIIFYSFDELFASTLLYFISLAIICNSYYVKSTVNNKLSNHLIF